MIEFVNVPITLDAAAGEESPLSGIKGKKLTVSGAIYVRRIQIWPGPTRDTENRYGIHYFSE